MPILVVDHLKKEKNKMADFDYRKWVTDYKTNKKSLFEQNITGSITGSPQITGSEVYVGCGQCNADSPTPGEFACMPGVEITVSLNQIEPNIVNTYSAQYLSSDEVIGGFEAIGYGGTLLFGPQTAQYLEQFCPSGSSTTIYQGNYNPFCCDINAMNFGQTADGQPYGTNLGEPEQYVMINGPQGDMCDNSICQGNVNQPDSIGDPPGPEGQGIPQPIATLGKDKLPSRRRDKGKLPSRRRIRSRNRRLREVKNSIKKEIKKLRK